MLIGPTGLFCLEVKGGRLARTKGMWLFTDRHGQVTQKSEGPFEQVAGATAALTHYVAEKLPQIWNVVVGYGVATPDIEFGVAGPDIEEKIVYDIRDESRSFSGYLAQIEDHWRKRLESQRGRSMRGLEKDESRRLAVLLRGDFDARRSLRTRVGLVNQELLRLTEEQYRVLDGLAEKAKSRG